MTGISGRQWIGAKLLALPTPGGTLHAQTFRAKPITIIVPCAACGAATSAHASEQVSCTRVVEHGTGRDPDRDRRALLRMRQSEPRPARTISTARLPLIMVGAPVFPAMMSA